MKKRLLFVMDSLGIGGGEKSLVTLLSLIDYSRFDVDLQLFSNDGEFVQFLPKEVNLLPILDYNRFLQKGLFRCFFSFDIKKIKARLSYSLKIANRDLSSTQKAIIFWKLSAQRYDNVGKYDVAIAYSQGLPTFYVVDKVDADKKIGWINCIWALSGNALTFNRAYYKRLDVINIVSDEATSNFRKLFPEYAGKFVMVKDMVSFPFVEKLSRGQPNIDISGSDSKILTVARLLKDSKGYDILLGAALILKDRGIRFHWYVLGNGDYREEMCRFIESNNLTEQMHLLGSVSNPYPFYRMCDIYVQTSRREGFGLSIAEARLLNCPVVTTEYVGVWSQMVQGKNGVVVPIDVTAVADAIEDLILHPEKREAISAYQRTEKKGNTEEIEKFYKLLE